MRQISGTAGRLLHLVLLIPVGAGRLTASGGRNGDVAYSYSVSAKKGGLRR